MLNTIRRLISRQPTVTSAAEPYLRLPYHITVVRCDEGWFAHVLEWRGCMTQAATWDELLPMVEDAMRCWAEYSLDVDLPIPEPSEGPYD